MMMEELDYRAIANMCFDSRELKFVRNVINEVSNGDYLRVFADTGGQWFEVLIVLGDCMKIVLAKGSGSKIETASKIALSSYLRKIWDWVEKKELAAVKANHDARRAAALYSEAKGMIG